MITLDVLEQLPTQPFKLTHNGEDVQLALAESYGPAFSIVTESRVYGIDDTYEVQVDEDTFTIHSDAYDSTFVISPIKLSDKSLLSDPTDIATVEDISERVINILAPSRSKIRDLDVIDNADGVSSEYNFTIDEDGSSVVELIRSDDAGIAVRDNGEWIDVNADEEQPTIDDLEWVEVSEDAVDFWDNATDTVKKDDILQFEVKA